MCRPRATSCARRTPRGAAPPPLPSEPWLALCASLRSVCFLCSAGAGRGGGRLVLHFLNTCEPSWGCRHRFWRPQSAGRASVPETAPRTRSGIEGGGRLRYGEVAGPRRRRASGRGGGGRGARGRAGGWRWRSQRGAGSRKSRAAAPRGPPAAPSMRLASAAAKGSCRPAGVVRAPGWGPPAAGWVFFHCNAWKMRGGRRLR
jgi:hypothetical protein